jgi:hypothetical protein
MLYDGLGKFHNSTMTLDFVVSKSFFYLLYYVVIGFVGLFKLQLHM